MATAYQNAVRMADADRLRKTAQDQANGTVNGQQANLGNLIRAGATQAEVQAFNDSGVVPQSFYDRNGQSGPMYVSLYGYDKVPGSSYENWKISDQNKDFYNQVQRLYQSGDVTGAINLMNEKRGKENDFTGYYDDQGNYWGWVRGEGGASGNSFQPVLGGQLMATGKSDTNTWLTPDGRVLNGSIGGNGLANNGLTWTNQHTAPRGYNTWGEAMDKYGLTWDQVAQAKAANGDYTDPSLNTEMGNAKAYYRLTTKPDYMDDAEWERYSKMWDPAYIQGFKNGANGQVFKPVTDYGIDYKPSGLLPEEYRGSQNYTGSDGLKPAGYVPMAPSQAPSIPQSSGYTPSPAGGAGGNSGTSGGTAGGTAGGTMGGTSSGTPNTPYSQAVSQYTPKSFDQAQPEAYQPTEAPAAYDPESNTVYQRLISEYVNGNGGPKWTGGDYNAADNQMYKDFLANYGNAQAPEYEGDPYAERRDSMLEQYGSPWEGSEYQQRRDEALSRAADMEWNYNPDEDPMWQAYQKQYRREGQRATQDTLGQAAAMTGGMASTAAVTAASQAGDYYASQLSDKLPQLYQDAYNRYLDEYSRQLGISEAYAGFDKTAYDRWQDQQGKNMELADTYNNLGKQDYDRYRDRRQDWIDQRAWEYGLAGDNISLEQGDYERKYKQYLDELDRYNADRDWMAGMADTSIGYGRTAAEDQYSRWGDQQERNRTAAEDQYSRWLNALAQNNYENETAYQHTRDAESDRQWQLEYDQKVKEWQAELDISDREWAQKLVEYADSQNWKRAEWEQYLREYGDKLSQAERDYVYKLSQAEEDKRRWDMDFARQLNRDSVADAKWEAQMSAQQEETEYQRGLDAWDRQQQEAKMATQPVYAYSSDGSTYDISSYKGQAFIDSAPVGATMTGGDGSKWVKNADGTVTITKNGRTWTYGTPKQTSSYGYSGNGYYGGGDSGGGGNDSGGGNGSSGGYNPNANVEYLASLLQTTDEAEVVDSVAAYNEYARANGLQLITPEDILAAKQMTR